MAGMYPNFLVGYQLGYYLLMFDRWVAWVYFHVWEVDSLIALSCLQNL